MSDSCRDRSLGNACLLKLAEEHPENSSYLTTPLRDPIREEANAGTHIGCNLTTTAEEPACSRCYAWHGSDGAMQLIQFNRNRSPDKQLLGSSYFTTPNIKC